MATNQIGVREILEWSRIRERRGNALRIGQSNVLNYSSCEVDVLAVDAGIEDCDRHIAAGYR